MEKRAFGKTGLSVSALGFGAGNIGDPKFSESECEFLLNSVVDSGMNLIDSARSYGLSEERIGRHLKHRRNDVVFSTKVGYGIPGIPDWTPACIEAGIENALRLFQTDVIDIVHFHSCPLPVLQQEDLIDALNRGVSSGKIRVAAYSGDNEPFDWALKSRRFQGLQTSLNICDQRATYALQVANESGIGMIAKRSLANTAWRNIPRPDDQAAEEYRKRWQEMNLGFSNEEAAEIALRFVAYLPGIHSCLIASTKPEHIRQNIAAVERGPLPQEIFERIRTAFKPNWPGMI